MNFMEKIKQQDYEFKKRFSTLTQKQANELFEYPNYNISIPGSEIL